MKLIREIFKSWRAEVIFITSNYQGNQEIMEGCKEEGIPAFVRLSYHLALKGSILILIIEGNLVGLLALDWSLSQAELSYIP